MTSQHSTSTNLVTSVSRMQTLASGLTAVLAAIAAGAGLFVPGLYRDPAVLLPQVYGQDLFTLVVAVPILVSSLVLARRGSRSAVIVWLGVTAYLLYTYASYAFMTAFNELYLVYTTLVWLTLYTLISGVGRLDVDRMQADLADGRRWPYVAFQLGLAVLVATLWLADILPAILGGTIPASISNTGLPVNVIHSLDLGIILPAYALSALMYWRGRAWGFAFTGILLVKAATLGGAILSMVALMVTAGQPVPLPQVVIFGAITLAALGLLAAFIHPFRTVRHPRESGRVTPGDD